MPTDRGFVRFYRSFWDNPLIKEPGRSFSKREAWLYLFSNLANGIDRNGVGRGEFVASVRYLAKTWRWSKTKVERFLSDLQAEGMIRKASSPCAPTVGHLSGHLAGQFCGHFIICNYMTYQDSRDTKRDTKRDTFRDKSNERIKEGITNESKNPLNPPEGDGGLFDKFWQAYPRHESKLLARKSWDRLNADDWLLDSIICWLDQAKNSKQWQDKSLIPHPSTFLNQRRWEADPPPAELCEKTLFEQMWGYKDPKGPS